MSIVDIMVSSDVFVKDSILTYGPFLNIEGGESAAGNENLHENRTFFGLSQNPAGIVNSRPAHPKQPENPSNMAETTYFALKEPGYRV